MPEAPALTDREVDADMLSDWNAIREKHAVEEETPEPESAPETEASEPEESAAPTRDVKTGRFQKGEKRVSTPAEAETPEEPAAEAPAKEAAQATTETGTRDINRAPSTWRSGARAEWDKLSPAVRAEIHRRESDFLSGQAQLMPDAQFGQGLRQVIEPYRLMMQAENASPEQAIGELLRIAAVFRVGSVQAKYQEIAKIAQQWGLDLRIFGQRPAQPGQQPQPQQFRDPRVDQLLQQQQQDRQATAARELKTVESAVTRWANEVDANGDALRPHINQVIDQVTALIPQIQAAQPDWNHSQVMQHAYESAIWAHPEIRTQLLQEQQTQAETKRRAESQQRAQAARRAASTNVPTRRGSIPTPGKPGKMEETIASTARELGLIA